MTNRAQEALTRAVNRAIANGAPVYTEQRPGHTPTYATDNYAAFEMRGGGFLLRRLQDTKEVFFQPGDDAASIRDSIDALDELPENKQDTVFDMVCSNYFD
jgi:hypothetical protein